VILIARVFVACIYRKALEILLEANKTIIFSGERNHSFGAVGSRALR
jgi:hypothetical protein